VGVKCRGVNKSMDDIIGKPGEGAEGEGLPPINFLFKAILVQICAF
jgi:hypothetical protein